MAMNVLFKKGSADAYQALENKVSTTFYFTEADESNEAALYLGTLKLSNQADVNAAVAMITAANQNIATNAGDILLLKQELAALTGTEDEEGNPTTIADMIATALANQLGTDTLTTDATTVKGAINEVDAHADAAQSAAEQASQNASAASALATEAKNEADALKELVGDDYGTKEVDGEQVNLTVKEYIDNSINNAKDTRVDTLIGSDSGKSVRTIAAEEIAAQLIAENAKESLDTLQEIAAWIQSHPDDAAAMNSAISDLQSLIGEIPEGSTATDIVGYVNEVVGAAQAQLSALNYTDNVEGDYVSSVSQTNGKIAIVKGTFNFDEKGAAAEVQQNLENALTWGEF